MQNREALWKKSELEAADWFLSRNRALLLARNFRVKQGGLDLIFEEELPEGSIELVFAEVRTRSLDGWVSALESVTYGKRLRLSRAIQAYLLRYRGRATSLRIDILARDGEEWTQVRNIVI
ncbi:MAG: hypothetical protein A2Z97_12180 [Bdellovibrionales bacterium GWB1_52_6]|nr:MAG: hypothetical protein A2Z97_12180 [Bdellovibrionales bacterium GWB1_52_6]